MRYSLRILALLGALAAVGHLAPSAWAQLDGRYRIELMSGRYVEGDVKEQPDGSYQVRTKHGVVVTVKKNEVRGIRPLEELQRHEDRPVDAPARVASALRRPISDEEIEQILSGITAQPDESLSGTGRDDMMAPLPLDEDSLQEMLKDAGADREKNVLIKDHFVMVYTSTPESARDLASRLEAVWRWNVKFMSMMNLPAHRPPAKLEIYYFGTWDEFDRYSRNQGRALPPGVLGYYVPEINRSHFFDLYSSPDIASFREQLKDTSIPWKTRQFANNRIRQYVEFHNVEVIQHETGHHIHFNIGLFPRDAFGGNSVPMWLVEGTTMLFEVPPSAAGASLGVLNHYRLNNLRRHFGARPLSAADWKLFLIDNNLWPNAAGHGSIFDSYQLGWSMVYYLWKEQRDKYAQYLQKIFGREEGETVSNTEREKEFEDIFGRVDEKWIDRYYAFLEKLQLRPSLLPPGEEPATGGGQTGPRRPAGGGRGGRGPRG